MTNSSEGLAKEKRTTRAKVAEAAGVSEYIAQKAMNVQTRAQRPMRAAGKASGGERWDYSDDAAQRLMNAAAAAEKLRQLSELIPSWRVARPA